MDRKPNGWLSKIRRKKSRISYIRLNTISKMRSKRKSSKASIKARKRYFESGSPTPARKGASREAANGTVYATARNGTQTLQKSGVRTTETVPQPNQ